MSEFELHSPAFHSAVLRSERIRVIVLLSIFASLIVLVLVRGGMSLAGGRTGKHGRS